MTVAETLAKSSDWLETRRRSIGGSDAKRIMEGDWFSLWNEKTGREPGEDLSRVLQVQLGSWTEPFNAHWFAKETGVRVTHEDCEHLFHPDYSFMGANLDGRIGPNIFEAKHVSAFAKDEEIVSRYFPQIQHCLCVSGASVCFLSVIFGNHRWAYFEVARNEEYQSRLIDREFDFWGHVQRDEPPPHQTGEKVAISLDDMREVDMTGSNEWAAAAHDWTENKAAAGVFKKADKALKELIEDDVKLAYGHEVKVSRAKNGALRVNSWKEN